MNRPLIRNVISALACVLLSVSLGGVAPAAFIETVPVGNPGNAADSTSFGSVGYNYRIGKYEVTAGQYTDFLNAIAEDDPNGLYNISMGSPVFRGANIQRNGGPGSYTYSVAPDWANRPINLVSFWDAARFANWLHNGQPYGPQGPGTTENGAYTLTPAAMSANSVARNAGARFFVPMEDEWYKAAYHDRSAGLTAIYFDYPTGTDLPPGRDLTESTNPGNNANYLSGNFLIGSPYYRTEVGEFELSDSPYGTFDQGGNVFEWNESILGPARMFRGGSFSGASGCCLGTLQAWSRGSYGPSVERDDLGFRIATIVPEPVGIMPCLAAALLCSLCRNKKPC